LQWREGLRDCQVERKRLGMGVENKAGHDKDEQACPSENSHDAMAF